MESKGRIAALASTLMCAVIFAVLAGCSAGGGGAVPAGDLKTGEFVDSPVDGLEYRALSPSGQVIRTGVTSGGGKFLYRDGEVISFAVGGIALGQAFAAPQVTPVDLVPGAFNETNYKVSNIARLLQSLDHDGQPENGITITPAVREGCRGQALRMTVDGAETVEQGLAAVVQDLGSRGLFADGKPRTLVSGATAQAHMRQTLAKNLAARRRNGLATFADRQEVENYFREQYASRLVPQAYGGIVAGTATAEGGPAAATPLGDGTVFSTTNVQEAGVDEGDVVKSDGEYLYVAAAGTVSISRVVPAEAMQAVGSVAVNGTIDSLYLYHQTLVVLYRPGGTPAPYTFPLLPLVGCPLSPPDAKTGVLLVNVQDPAHPATILDFVADGTLTASRLTGGRLLLVQQFRPTLPAVQYWYDQTEENREKVVQANRAAIAAMNYGDFIPSYTLHDAAGQPSSGALVAPENFYRPPEPQGGSVVTVTTFNLDAPSPLFSAIGLIADVGTVYASPNALYLTSTRWDATADGTAWAEETVIHKLDLTAEKVVAVGSGTIPGRVLNQFSLGEYDGVLRIAVTTEPSLGAVVGIVAPATTRTNSVYCLRAQEDTLKVIGKVEDLGSGERIYAARFVGPRGFLVTFRQVDPLFTLDLTDPTSPTVAGVLKVPGYADYLHLLDADHLLAVGKDAVEDTTSGIVWYQGMQLSIFDISDFAHPTLLHKEPIGVRGTTSEALGNARAFAFLAQKNLFALPVNVCAYQDGLQAGLSQYGESVFNGLYVYRVTAAQGFELIGKIPTSSASWTRGIFIDNSVYAVQQDRVISAAVGNLTAQGWTLTW